MRASSIEVFFHLFKISLIVLSSDRVDLQLLESKFCSIPAISLLFRQGRLPLRTFSMEVVFHLFEVSLIVLSSNRVDLQLLESKFCSFPAISLLFWTGGQPAGEINTM